MSDAAVDSRPFGSIALSFSGGGGRAVGFHLGTVAYLDRLGLLGDVEILSSVSGGSFIGTGLAVAEMEGQSFADYYQGAVDFLQDVQLVDWSLKHLAEKPRVRSGRRSLIRAVADVYDERYFKGRRFGMFWEPQRDVHFKDLIFNATEFKTGRAFRFQWSRGQLGGADSDADRDDAEEPVTMSFPVAPAAEGRIGNGKVWIREELAKKIRIADIMAASSCIPGGFEPLFFPRDFSWPGSPEEAERICEEIEATFQEHLRVDSVALMDGGIYDNQGIESVMLALRRQGEDLEARHENQDFLPAPYMGRWMQEVVQGPAAYKGRRRDARTSDIHCPKCRGVLVAERYRGTEVDRCSECSGVWFDAGEAEKLIDEDTKLGLFIISDAPEYSTKPLYPKEPLGPQTGRMTLNALFWAGALVAGLSAISVALLLLTTPTVAATFGSGLQGIIEGLAWAIPVFLAAGTVVGLFWLNRERNRLLREMQEIQSEAYRPWEYLRRLRVSDVTDMFKLRLGSLFSLVNEVFLSRVRQLSYGQLFAQRRYRGRIITHEIYDLMVKPWKDYPDWMHPSEAMEAVADEAATMATKLWFTRPPPGQRGDLNTLIACGQMTMCFNLLEHVYRQHRRTDDPPFTPELRALYDRARADWERLKQDPFVFVDERAASTD